MKLALTAKLKIDPGLLLSSRWAHDIAHAMAVSVHEAQSKAGRPLTVETDADAPMDA